ncbi:MAG: 2Fe-2S iron-sulfur cluster-binding protein [Planctomycetota bacterium]|jgi:NADPH-dependent glutamate synthase beta subunit-like oxidoreductase
MPKLFIDNRKVEVDDGATVLDAAEELGIEIPTMCFLKGCKASTSCMVCVVKVDGLANLVPACGTVAKESMRVESDCEEVHQSRKAALELLLSDHVGDCIGPCQITCPARMNIPLMIRQIAAGELRDAIATVKKDIALPAVLGRICSKPCERACRRNALDEAVSICLLKRYAADVDLQSANPYLPACKPVRNKRVAIIGAGPAGLAAAYYLRQDGFGCTVFDDHEKPGGALRYAVSQQELPREVLDKEIALIEKLGVKFQGRTRVAITPGSMEDLRKDFDAVFVAVGPRRFASQKRSSGGDAGSMGLETGPNGIAIDRKTYQTNLAGVFAGGDAVRNRKLTVRAVADGKEAAVSISQYLSGQAVTGATKAFNIHIGKLKDGEIEKFMACATKGPRVRPSRKDYGFTDGQAREEAVRCLHCDCRKTENCRLRQYAQEYGARPGRYKGERRLFVQQVQHPDVIYEPGKCIDCGLCIQIAAKAGEELGLTFIGRGFDVRVAVPFDRSLAQGLKRCANQCVSVCPTGALAFKDNPKSLNQ